MNATYNTIDRLVADRRHAFETAADRHRLVTTSHRRRLVTLLPTRLADHRARATRAEQPGERSQTPTTAAA